MTRDLLIRDLPPEDIAWIGKARPLGVTQNEFLHEIVRRARAESMQPTLFDGAAQPRIIHGQLPFKFIDLFAGIGGFRSAMTAIGGECVFTSEWDKYAAKTYRAWYGDEHVHTGDIRDISPAEDIPDHDVLCGGFPCQPFSLAGVSKKNSLGRLFFFFLFWLKRGWLFSGSVNLFSPALGPPPSFFLFFCHNPTRQKIF